MDLFFYGLWTLVLTTGLVAPALPLAAERRAGPLTAFVGYAVIQTVALLCPFALGWQIGRFNWVGKVLSICVSLVAIRLLRLSRAEVGLVLPNGKRGWAASGVGLGAAILLGVILVLVFGPNGRPSAETLAFEATMPGLDEELAFRGIAMALLTQGLAKPRSRLPAWGLPLAITSVWFTIGHVVGLDHGHLVVGPAQVMVAILAAGVLLTLIRVGSFSLLGCVVAHNTLNILVYVASYVFPLRG